MLKFLRKKKIQVPDNYKNLIGQSEYEIFVNQCLNVLKDLGVDVNSHENGDITYIGKNEDSHYFLDNLVDIPVILTPYSGHIDPPTGSWF